MSREVFQCQNGGVCFSTNEGPKCDCSDSDYEGKLCDIEKTDAELTFSGNEWIGYDVSANISAIVRAKTENITLSFKTVHGTAVIFFAGDEKSFIHLMLENGALIASSKLEGTDVRIIRLFNKFPAERYDDDTWHSVTLERTLQVMKLRVDDQKDQIRQYAPEMDWIYNSFFYIGGVPNEHKSMGVNKTPFRGCIKMIRYIADSMKINFVSLADESYGESIIRTGGDLSFSCKNPAPPPDILSFHPGATPLLLTKWTSDAKGGSISFQFRSTEPDGLILLLSSMIDNSSEYLAFELIDGHLYMIIDLGAGSIRLQTTFKRLTDSNSWNSVYMERIRRHGKIIVNSHKTDFNTPGTSANLDVVDPILIGGLPQSNFVYPSSIWSITLRKSFVGCIKNVRINGISAKIASAFESVNSTGITLGCPSEKDNCSPNPCHNYGKCSSGTLSFKCDCSQTTMTGATCNTEPVFYSIDGEQKMLSIYPRTVLSEAEDIEIRFKTEQSLGCLIETRSNAHPANFLAVFLLDGMLHIVIQTISSKTVHMWGEPVSDSKWHTAKVKRRGNNMLLYFDGKWGSSYTLNSSLVVEVDEVVGARSFKSDERFQAPFRGHISQLSFNSVDLLNKIRKESKPNKENKGLRNIKSKLLSVSFTNSTGFISFSADKISSLTGNFRVSFKFQTLVRTCLLFAYLPVSSNDYLMIQLINARIRYSFRFGKSEGSILSPRLPNKQHLSDMRWHSILLYQNQDTLDHVILIDNTTSTIHLNSTAVKNVFVISGPAVLGGVPPSLASHTALSAQGFRGCISTLRLNDRLIDILEEAHAMHSITKGCNGPMSRCSPFACANGGRCIQQWTNIFCDCTFTSFAGTKCSEPATTFSFNSEVTGLYYEYPPGEMPSTSKDFMVIAFSTKRLSGVLFSVESSAEPDFFTLYLDGGMLQLKYNLGSGMQHFGIFSKTVSDGKLHTVKLFRFEYNVTLQLDNSTPVRYTPKDGIELTTLNMHWRLVVGASMNSLHILRSEKTRYIRESGDFTVYNSFNGEISGVNFNGISILDLYVQGSPRVFAIGPVKKIHESPPVSASSEEIMHEGMENSADALIESLGASCLSVEEHDSCYVETEQTGFFTPVIPSAVTAPRRATTNSPTSSTAVRGESPRKPADSTRNSIVSRPSSSSSDSIISYSTTSPPLTPPSIIYLSSLEGTEASDLDSSTHRTTITVTTASTSTTSATVETPSTIMPPPRSIPDSPLDKAASDTRQQATSSVGSDARLPGHHAPVGRPTSTRSTISPHARRTTVSPRSTVLPRPYESVSLAAEQNPEYLGDSIWADIDLLPEPMVTGPAWRAHQNTSSRTGPLTTQMTAVASSSSTTMMPTTAHQRRKTTNKQMTAPASPMSPLKSLTEKTTSSLTFSTLLSTTTTRLAKPKTSPSFTVYPVRPTTPMGELLTTTMKYNTGEAGEFPRTALVMIASLTVVLLIAIVVFCVFRCRQNPPPNDHYPMAVNGVKAPSGYTAIAPDLSPPLGVDPSTQPLLGRQPQVNGNGYQPLKGSVMPNGMYGMNGNGRSIMNGNGKNGGTIKKKDFKEWYV
ncbi:unnamed protein product [Auanema sp. JU1783]|nr:unnamed protein product [Auanema sp. JU1783]